MITILIKWFYNNCIVANKYIFVDNVALWPCIGTMVLLVHVSF